MSTPASSQASQKPYKCSLPPEKVFSIQIGTECFRLSGASLASDAPSYFSSFFEEQLRQNGDGPNTRTLYIDRDPTTFQEIARHLQGYHIRPSNGSTFVKLFADAQFYSLPRLISQLFESEIFIQIGDRDFQIPRDIFSGPGDSPNFFSLGFGAFFASPSEIFPGLNRHGLLRPPAIVPPSVPNRSGDIFAQLLHLLRGYPLQITNETHRAELLRDCRYFHLRGLEQKLIPHHISFNPVRHRSEIIIRLEDVRRSGISLAAANNAPDAASPGFSTGGWVTYSRPYVDDQSHDLILEIGDETTMVDLRGMRAYFLNLTKSRFSSLLQVTAGKITNAPAGSIALEESARIRIESDADLTVDGKPKTSAEILDISSEDAPGAKRRRVEGGGAETEGTAARWIVRNGQWKVYLRPRAGGGLEFVLGAVKLDAYTEQRERNRTRAFLC